MQFLQQYQSLRSTTGSLISWSGLNHDQGLAKAIKPHGKSKSEAHILNSATEPKDSQLSSQVPPEPLNLDLFQKESQGSKYNHEYKHRNTTCNSEETNYLRCITFRFCDDEFLSNIRHRFSTNRGRHDCNLKSIIGNRI